MAWLSNPKSKWITQPDRRGLQRIYYFLSSILYILETVSPEHSIKSRLKDLVLSKPESVTLRSMGFPSNWSDQEIWKD
jgi:abortive infection bacteriophage resistance protein